MDDLYILRTRSLSGVLEDEVEKAILGGEIAPGGRVNENALAGRYGVSRGPLREALRTLQAAGLVETLKGKGPFTVFAPTNAAFAKLPAGTVDTLLKPEDQATLAKILTYHVVAGKVTAADVVKLKSAETVNGKAVKITTGDRGVMVNDATVTATDIKASNGVIHVIDSVLIP